MRAELSTFKPPICGCLRRILQNSGSTSSLKKTSPVRHCDEWRSPSVAAHWRPDLSQALEPVLKMGGAGDPPAPVDDPPTGTAASNVAKRPNPLTRSFAPVPSGESPDGTGGSPVLPANHFSNMRLEKTGAPTLAEAARIRA